jgi:hypothetical protein
MRHRGARRVGRRDPPPLSSPTVRRPKDARPLDGLCGEDAQRSNPRVNSRAEGAKAPNCENMGDSSLKFSCIAPAMTTNNARKVTRRPWIGR